MFIVAHRGASAYKPENTLESIKKAVELKAEYVEVDLRRTKDGELILLHDETVDRVTGGKGKVENLTLEEVKKLRVKGNERIPTLKEVINYLKKKKTNLVIEIKVEGIEEEVLNLLEETGFLKRCIITSFLHPSIKKIRNVCEKVDLGVIISCKPLKPHKIALESGANYLFQKHKYVDLEIVEKCHSEKVKVVPWTVDDLEIALNLKKLGVDGLVTNKPDLLT